MVGADVRVLPRRRPGPVREPCLGVNPAGGRWRRGQAGEGAVTVKDDEEQGSWLMRGRGIPGEEETGGALPENGGGARSGPSVRSLVHMASG